MNVSPRDLTLLSLLLCAACAKMEDEPLPGDNTGDDVGAEEDSGGEELVLSTSDQMYSAIEGEYVEPMACDGAALDLEATAFSIITPGCGYAVDLPTWERPVSEQKGLQDLRSSCAAEGDSAEPRHVHVSFADYDTTSSTAVVWMTYDTVTGYSDVRLGTSPDSLDMVARGFSFTYPGIANDRRVHEAHLCGLEAGTTYYYQVGGGETWSEVYSFTTGPEMEPDASFTFAVAGDSRSETQELWAQALDGIDSNDAELLVFTGDAVYSGLNQWEWDTWWTQAEGTEQSGRLSGLPILYASGNHDLVGDPMWAMLAQPGNELNFVVRYGNAAYIILDDTGWLVTGQTVDGPAKEFLETALQENQDAEWIFVAHHRPPYSAGARHGSNEQLQNEWVPLYEQYGVDIVFNGHEHNYERSKPILNGEPNDDGVRYMVVAGIGAPMYDIGSGWWTEVGLKTPTYAIFDIEGSTLTGTTYDLEGNIVDSFEIVK